MVEVNYPLFIAIADISFCFPFYSKGIDVLKHKRKWMMKNLNNHKFLVFLDMPAFSSHQSACLVMLSTQSSIQMKCCYMTEENKMLDWIIAFKVKSLTLLNYRLKGCFLNGLKPQSRAYKVIFCFSGSWDINSDVLESSSHAKLEQLILLASLP